MGLLSTENIEIGHVFKNYGEICDFFDMPRSTGRGRQNDFKKFHELMELEKKGNSYTVTAILKDSIIEKRNWRNTPAHVQFMKLLLLNILKKREDGVQYYSTTALATALQLIGDRYIELFSDKNIISIAENFDIHEGYIEDFISSINPAYKNTIEVILNQLNKYQAIMYDTVTMVTYIDKDTKEEIREPADAKMKNKMMKIKQECMKKVGKSMTDICNNNLSSKYYNLVKQAFKNELGITYYYKAYEINTIQEMLEDEYAKLLAEMDIDSNKIDDMTSFLKYRVSTEWRNSSEKRFSTRKANAVSKNSFGEAKSIYQIRTSDSYEDVMMSLYDVFVMNKHP